MADKYRADLYYLNASWEKGNKKDSTEGMHW